MGWRLDRLLQALLVTAVLVTAGIATAAEKRVALVIGNSAYRHASPLRNPANDARKITAALEQVGFKVTAGYDLDYAGMRATIGRFERELDDAGVALVYYSGHGIGVDGVNYLIPVDATLETKSQLQLETISADWLLNDVVNAEERVSIIMLDACRNNPFSRSFAARTRGAVATGLAEIQAKSGAYIAFATAPGNTASDGAGENSPFTNAVLRHITTPGLEIDRMMKAVRREVLQETGNGQLPWTSSALLGDFYFLPPGGSDSPALDAARVGDMPPFVIPKRAEPAPAPEPQPSRPSGEELRVAALQRVENALLQTAAARRSVQKNLALLGYASGRPDGRFGPATREALAMFQAAMKLEVKGYVDKPTLTALERQVALAMPAAEPARPRPSRPEPSPAARTDEPPATPVQAAPVQAGPVAAASGWTMGECMAPGGAAWAGMRILTADQCRKIGGIFSPL